MWHMPYLLCGSIGGSGAAAPGRKAGSWLPRVFPALHLVSAYPSPGVPPFRRPEALPSFCGQTGAEFVTDAMTSEALQGSTGRCLNPSGRGR